jgi:uncharacterized protein YggE
MRRILTLVTLATCAILLLAALPLTAQIGGDSVYGQQSSRARAEQEDRSQRTLTAQDLPPNASSMFLDAAVLINVKPDAYVAVFALAQQAPTLKEAGDRMDTNLKQFTASLAALGIRPADIFVDYIADPKIYTFDNAPKIAHEKLTGFELKKNVSIHFTGYALLDKLTQAAADAGIYDLVKLDYIVTNIPAVQQQLRAEAAKIIRQKSAAYESLLGIKPRQPAAILADRTTIHYPTQLYDSYVAAESGEFSPPPNRAFERAPKTRTFYFDGLTGDGFDKVINPILLAPAVQFTLYLKVKYAVAR